MKKYSYILFTLWLIAAACTDKGQQGETVSNLKGMLRAGVDSANSDLELFPERSKTIEVRVYADTENGSVSGETLNITLQPDPDAVEAYNAAHGTDYLRCPGQAFEMVSSDVMLPRYGTSSSSAKVKITAVGMDSEKTYLLPIGIASVSGSGNWELSPNPIAFIKVRQAYVAPDAGTGTREDPFKLYTLTDLLEMSDKMDNSRITYFSLMNDIDMQQMPWIPLNFAQPYDLQRDFNGNNHTLDNFYCNAPNYPGFFGVLYGKCYDLNITNALIEGEAAASCGIMGGYCGTTGLPGEARNCHVQGVVNHTGAKNGIGGLFGRLNTATVVNCSADCEVTANCSYVGGLFGYDAGASIVSDCYTKGSVKGNQRVGGIVGGLITQGSKMYNCYSTMSVQANFAVGGIAGHCNQDQKAGTPEESTPNNVVDKCIAWNTFVHATNTDDSDHYSSGAIVGFTSIKNYLSDCYRRPDLDFQECATGSFNVLYDQENASPAAPLTIAVAGPYNYPYHGKAAGAGSTVSSVAKALGWSEEVWDFSGEFPVHKTSTTVNPDEPQDQDSTGQLPDFFDENVIY